MRSRLKRVRRYLRGIIALTVGSVALLGALTVFKDKFGYWVLGILAGTSFVVLFAVFVIPERLWVRFTGTDTLASDIGVLHTEGALLRHELPWVPDHTPEGFAEWAARTDDWFTRVQSRLEGSQWLGTLLSPVSAFRTATSGYETASRYRNGLDDKLERLSQIIIAIGGRS